MAITYTPLRSDQHEIRLLTLEPGDNGHPIQLRIETTTLDHADKYTCLSYAWGSPDPKRSVEVNGCPFDVRENLYLALLRLRSRVKPLRLWIDAICICQDDTKEREAQVSIMQHIFSRATDVIAWIGEDNGARDRRATVFMRELSAKSKSHIHAEHQGTDTISSGTTSRSRPLDEQTVDWLESVTPFGMVDSIWLDFTALIDRPWFSRIWIVQEVVMGKEVTVQCGPHQFSWGDLFNCALFVHEHAQLIQSFAAPDCLRYHSPEKAEFYSKSLPLYHLLRATKNIRSVGYLASKRQMHRLITAIAEPAIKQYLSQQPTAEDEAPGHLWGMLSSDLRSLSICSTRPPQDENTPLNPTLVYSPDLLRTYLNLSKIPNLHSLGHILTVINNIPIYFTNTTPDNNTQPAPRAPTWHLHELLTRFRPFFATEPATKSTPSSPPLLPGISYHPSTTVLDILWEVVATHLREHGNLEFLRDACGLLEGDGADGEGWPTWMPLSYDTTTTGNLSKIRRVPVPLGRLGNPPGMGGYRASGGVRAVVAGMDKTHRTLTVAGKVLGRVGMVHGEVFDQDVEMGERLAVMRRWAGVFGLEGVEALRQVLTGLRCVGRFGEEEAKRRMEEALGGLAQQARELYARFVDTLMASGSDAGTEQLANLPASARTAVLAQMLGSKTWHSHDGQPWQLVAEGRMTTVCNGRRLFVCDTEGGPGDATGTNFGLCPENSRAGDLVVLLVGSDVLHLLRQVDVVDGQAGFGFVGEAYVHNWMDGHLTERVQGLDGTGLACISGASFLTLR